MRSSSGGWVLNSRRSERPDSGFTIKKCAVWGEPYTVYGWDGYQVRDNIDAEDVASAVFLYAENPKDGIYNIGGGPANSISVREAVSYLSATHGFDFPVTWNGPPRLGDHRWYITNTQCFESHYKTWTRKPIKEVIDALVVSERSRREFATRDAAVPATAE